MRRPHLLSAARWAVDAALLLLVVVALATLVVGRVLPALGHQTVVITGRSMEPTIPVWSVVVLEPATAADLSIGDVVTVTTPDGRVTYTHRIAAIVDSPDGPAFRTHGDANATDDPVVVPLSWLKGRSVAVLPILGYPTRLLSSAAGVMFVISLSMSLFLLGRLIEDIEWDRRRAHRALIARMLTDSERSFRTAAR